MTNSDGDSLPPAKNMDPIVAALLKFEELIPDERAAVSFVSQLLRVSNDQTCTSCGQKCLELQTHARVLLCLNCKQKTWFTAGTFFHGIRRIKEWLFGIWLIQGGYEFSANKLAKVAGTSYDLARTIVKTVEFILLDQLQFEGSFAPSELFANVFYRRSRSTPANLHPISELDEKAEDQSTLTLKTSTNTSETEKIATTDDQKSEGEEQSLSLSNEEELVLNFLSSTPLQFDEIAHVSGLSTSKLASTLTLLEFNGLIENLVGDTFIRARKKTKYLADRAALLESVDGTLRNEIDHFTTSIRAYMQGISHKYLQPNLARHWCIRNPLRWGENKLFELCARSKRILKPAMLTYVAPFAVLLFVPGSAGEDALASSQA